MHRIVGMSCLCIYHIFSYQNYHFIKISCFVTLSLNPHSETPGHGSSNKHPQIRHFCFDASSCHDFSKTGIGFFNSFLPFHCLHIQFKPGRFKENMGVKPTWCDGSPEGGIYHIFYDGFSPKHKQHNSCDYLTYPSCTDFLIGPQNYQLAAPHSKIKQTKTEKSLNTQQCWILDLVKEILFQQKKHFTQSQNNYTRHDSVTNKIPEKTISNQSKAPYVKNHNQGCCNYMFLWNWI